MYLRIFTEGILGLKPRSLDEFELKINLPKQWDFIELKRLHVIGMIVNLRVERLSSGKIKVIVSGDIDRELEILSNQNFVISKK